MSYMVSVIAEARSTISANLGHSARLQVTISEAKVNTTRWWMT